MNEVVSSLGLLNTHFMNPTGLDEADHYSTARELAQLAATALDNETLASIMATPQISLTSVGPEEHVFDLVNSNELLAEDGIHGVKTGTTEAAGGCLVTAAWFHGPNRVITVVLGSAVAYDDLGNKTVDARFDDTRALFDALQTDYRWISPTDPEDMPDLAEELAAWQVTLKPGPAIVLAAADLPRFHYRVRLGPAGPPDSEVGSVVFFVGSVSVANRPLYQASQNEGASAVAPSFRMPVA
jgi:D-alanyl-D-alanine carboxypeptidase (penicillin-binding protein 5/6)